MCLKHHPLLILSKGLLKCSISECAFVSTETVCFRKKLSMGIKQKGGQLRLEGSRRFSRQSPGAAVGVSSAPMLHSVESQGRDPGARAGGRADGAQRQRPGSVRERGPNLSAVPSAPRVCVRAWPWPFYFFCCCFSVSTGELKYGDVWDTSVRVKKAFSSFCRVRGERCGSTLLSLCPEKAIIFPNGSPIMLPFMRTGYYT